MVLVSSVLPGSPRLGQYGGSLARRSGHDLGGFSAGCLQLLVILVSRWPLTWRRSRVEPGTRGGGDVLGYALDIGLRQLADGAGADEPGLLTHLVPELPDGVLDCAAEGSDLR
jgi:hypothetical protein